MGGALHVRHGRHLVLRSPDGCVLRVASRIREAGYETLERSRPPEISLLDKWEESPIPSDSSHIPHDSNYAVSSSLCTPTRVTRSGYCREEQRSRKSNLPHQSLVREWYHHWQQPRHR